MFLPRLQVESHCLPSFLRRLLAAKVGMNGARGEDLCCFSFFLELNQTSWLGLNTALRIDSTNNSDVFNEVEIK